MLGIAVCLLMGTLNLIFFETVVCDLKWGHTHTMKGLQKNNLAKGFSNTQRTKQLKLECMMSPRCLLVGFILIASHHLTVHMVLVIPYALMLHNANGHCLKYRGFRSEIIVHYESQHSYRNNAFQKTKIFNVFLLSFLSMHPISDSLNCMGLQCLVFTIAV